MIAINILLLVGGDCSASCRYDVNGVSLECKELALDHNPFGTLGGFKALHARDLNISRVLAAQSARPARLRTARPGLALLAAAEHTPTQVYGSQVASRFRAAH